MSTSVTTNVAPRAATPEHHVAQSPAQQPQEDNAAKAPHPVDGIPFSSPVIKVDNNTGLALLVVRDSTTGTEVDQYPSKKAVAEYQRVQGSASEAPAPATASSENGQPLPENAQVPPAPVAAPPVSPETGDARTTPSTAGATVKPVSL